MKRPSTTIMVVCAALIVTLAMGVRQSFGLFLPGVSADLGVGRQAFGFAVAIQNLVFGLMQPFVGALADRRGSGRIVAAGAVVYVAGLVLAGLSGGAASLTLSLGLLIGLALSGTTFVVVFGPVARAVEPAKRSEVLGLVTAGGSLGQFLVVPAVQVALSAYDWRVAFWLLAGLAAAMCVLAFGVSGHPETEPGEIAETGLGAALREAAGSRDFWLLNLGFFVCGFHIAFVGTHLPAYLVDRGLPASIGAWCLALVGLFNIGGSFAWGAWGGRYPRPRLLSALYAARGVAIAVFLAAPLSATSALAFAAAFGFLWLGTVPLTSGLIGQIYGVRYLSTLYGLVFLSHQIGSFIGAWWAGAMFDATGGYDGVWLTAMALAAAAALIHLPIRESPPTVVPA